MKFKNTNKKTKAIIIAAGGVVVVLLILLAMFSFNKIEDSIYPKEYSEYVEKYSKQFGVDENLIYAIIRTESGFDEKAVSNANARGLMQITEETFAWIKLKIANDEDLTFDSLFDAEVNIRFGTYLMSYCLEKYFGDVKTAAAAYHSGIGLVDSLLQDDEYSADGITLNVFPYEQMNNYVFKIQDSYDNYTTLYNG